MMGSLPNLHELGRSPTHGGVANGLIGGGSPAQAPDHVVTAPNTGSLSSGVHHRVAGPSTSTPYYCHANPSGPAGGGGVAGGLSYEERQRILHRHSSHCKGPKYARYAVRNRDLLGAGGPTSSFDDYTMDQVPYSPTSTRSSRRNLAQHSIIRRRDSVNSSIGANSVRRLIATIVRTNTGLQLNAAGGGGGGGGGSALGGYSMGSGRIPYSRPKLIRNLTCACVSHTLVTAALLPFLALQGAMSAWMLPFPNSFTISINLGSELLAMMHAVAALACLIGPYIIQKLNAVRIIALGYVLLGFFFAVHLYPVLYALLSAYALCGLVLGTLSVSRVAFLQTVSAKICQLYSDYDEEMRAHRRSIVVRRVVRAFQGAHDVGLILGSLLTAGIVAYTINHSAGSGGDPGAADFSINSSSLLNTSLAQDVTNQYQYASRDTQLDDVFDVDETSERICGAQACPSVYIIRAPYSMLPSVSAQATVITYATLCAIAAVVVAAGLDRLPGYVQQDPRERRDLWAAVGAVQDAFRDRKLQMAAPLALFVGMEQAFMFATFSQSYVVCTLGIHRLNWVFLCMGLLQSVAACTLSMLMRTIKRYYVIVGFAFHACLLMVQMVWKPLGDDPALFYVISAAWGVCNAVWEMLLFTLVTTNYADGSWAVPYACTAFFRYLGSGLTFAVHGRICNTWKVYGLAVAMLAAIAPLTWLEMRVEAAAQHETGGSRRRAGAGGGSSVKHLGRL